MTGSRVIPEICVFSMELPFCRRSCSQILQTFLALWITLVRVFVFFPPPDLPDGFQDDFSICYNLFFPTGLRLIIENARKKTLGAPVQAFQWIISSAR
jgi:hypothetical protein